MFEWFRKTFMSEPLLTNREWLLINKNDGHVYERRWSERPTGPLLGNVQAANGFEWRKASDFK